MSVISKEMRIRGDCVVDGKIRIEGSISGDVRASGLELVESGSVEGDLSAADEKGSFVIAGRVDGSVRAGRVDVSSTGAVLQGVEAEEAHVRGRIAGGVIARRRLVLEETAVVEGDVQARTLALKEGGQVNGTIVMGDRASLDDPGADAEAKAKPSATTPSGADAGDRSGRTSKRDPARPKGSAADGDPEGGGPSRDGGSDDEAGADAEAAGASASK